MSRVNKVVTKLGWVVVAGVVCSGVGCASPDPDKSSGYCAVGQKCDTPIGSMGARQFCAQREHDALQTPRRQFYTPTAVRWSCVDVQGVNAVRHDDRGQEYCEYFAVLNLSGKPDASFQDTTLVGRDIVASHSITTPEVLSLTLTPAQKSSLESQATSDPNAEVGSCMFTSWHFDVPGPAPACGSDNSCPSDTPSYLKLAQYSDDIWQMQSSINSNLAARDLAEKCMNPASGQKDSTLKDPYQRGCMLIANLFQTEWRKSDPTICAGMMRVAECGCGTPATKGLPLDAAAEALANALLPPPPALTSQVLLRGFPLGTWSGMSELPQGCRYVSGKESNGQASQTTVACKLTAQDLLDNANDLTLSDMKDVCGAKYGNDVVVHIPIPTAALSCTPPEGAMCSAQPWNVAAQ